MSLKILLIAKNGVAMSLSPTEEGMQVRVQLYKVDDPETIVADKTVDAPADSTTTIVQFDSGLEHWVKYGIKAYIIPDPSIYDPEDPETNAELYEGTFTTKRDGGTKDGGELAIMPVLPADYDLFSWNAWPNSYAALVSGGYTYKFERACWNAIVDHLYNAIMDAGLEWYRGLDYGEPTVDDVKFADGEYMLYAYKLNKLTDEIYRLAHFPFAWEFDKNFRGYVGRRHFLGFADVGQDADYVYAEYILELVRRLNLLLKIMRGWGTGLLQARAVKLISTGTSRQRMDWGLARRMWTGAMGVWTLSRQHFFPGRGRPMWTDAMGVSTDQWHDLAQRPGRQLRTDAMGVRTWGANFMQQGIPKRLRTDKSQVGTDTSDGFFNALSQRIYTDKSGVHSLSRERFRNPPGISRTMRQQIRIGQMEAIRGGVSRKIAKTAKITIPWKENILPGVGVAAAIPKRALSRTASLRVFRRGVVRRVYVQQYVKNLITTQAIRLGGPGRSVLHSKSNTLETNRMMGGIPKYLQVDRSLCNTDFYRSFRGAEGMAAVMQTRIPVPYRGIARGEEGLKAAGAITVKDVGVGGVRNGTPGILLPRGMGQTQKSELLLRQGSSKRLMTDKALSAATGETVLRYDNRGRFTGQGLSDTRKNWGNVRHDDHGRIKLRGHSATDESRLLARSDHRGRMGLQGQTKSSQSRLFAKYDHNGRMHLRGHSGTDKSRLAWTRAPGQNMAMEGHTRMHTTGSIDVGTPVGLLGRSGTAGTGNLFLGVPIGEATESVASWQRGRAEGARSVNAVMHGICASSHSHISFRSSEQVELEMTRHKVVSFFKAPAAETAPGAVAVPQGSSRMDAKALKIDAAVVKSLQLDAVDIPLLQSSPDISPSLGREVAAVVLPIRTKYGKPGLFLGVPKYTSWQTVPLVTDYEGQAEQGRGEGFEGEDKFATGQRLEAQTADSGVLAGSGFAKPKTQMALDAVKVLSVEAGENNATKATAAVGTAWLPPVWIDGGLWIRQSHSATQNENGELVIT